MGRKRKEEAGVSQLRDEQPYVRRPRSLQGRDRYRE